MGAAARPPSRVFYRSRPIASTRSGSRPYPTHKAKGLHPLNPVHSFEKHKMLTLKNPPYFILLKRMETFVLSCTKARKEGFRKDLKTVF
jgi:hypothetical protein